MRLAEGAAYEQRGRRAASDARGDPCRRGVADAAGRVPGVACELRALKKAVRTVIAHAPPGQGVPGMFDLNSRPLCALRGWKHRAHRGSSSTAMRGRMPREAGRVVRTAGRFQELG